MKKSHRAGLSKLGVRLFSVFLALSLAFSLRGGAFAETAEASGAPYASISGDITVPQRGGITFTITGDAYFVVGSSGVVDTCQLDWIGDQRTYSVGAVGEPGSSTGLYLAAPGQAPQKFCVITVGPPEEASPSSSPGSFSTKIDYSDNYYYLKFQSLKQNEIMYSEISVSDPNLSLSISSSDETVIQVTELQPIDGSPGHYAAGLYAAGQGCATLTITASDGTVSNMPVTVEGSIGKDYTLSSDTTQGFSIPQNGSYLLKLNYTYTGPIDDPTSHGASLGGGNLLSFPMLVSDNPGIEITPVAQNGDEFLFRIDAAGAVGQSAALYAGSYNYMPEKLCDVTISAAPAGLRLDTAGAYQCNTGNTYDFVAYTDSATPPAADAVNDLVGVEYVKKVPGGYEYRMTAHGDSSDSLFYGSSLVRVTQGKETVSFPVEIDNSFEPTVKSDTNSVVKLAKGESYIYKLTIMGGGDPYFTGVYQAVPTRPTGDGIMDVHLVKKDGLDYYVKVTATGGLIGDETYVCVRFPHSRWYDPNQFSGYGTVQIARDPSLPVIPMKSDTTKDFTLEQYKPYIFKLTGAALFEPGTPGLFRTELIRKSGSDSYYRVTPTGGAGMKAGFYMSNGITTEKVCVITIGPYVPVVMKSDTTRNFSLARGQSYTFRLTGATAFNPGTDGVFATELVKRSDGDAYYKITAVGPAGSSSGLYMGVPNQPVQKVCTVSVTEPGTFTSDTTSDFTLPALKSYTFKITAPGAKTVNLTAGTPFSFHVVSSQRSGDDFYFTIASSIPPVQDKSSGVYISVDGGSPKRICVVTLAAADPQLWLG